MAYRRTKHAVRRWYGEIYRIPPKSGGALAHCAFCSWSEWVEDNKRARWNAVDRANAAVRGHVHKSHPERCLKYEVIR